MCTLQVVQRASRGSDAPSVLPLSTSFAAPVLVSDSRSLGERLVSMASDPAEEHLRSPDVWFEDGTLVVRAETTVFRVYRGILASQSEVFKDMLAFPQPDDPEAEAFDGCPVVRVQDSAEDMSCFLRVLHDTKYAIYLSSSLPRLKCLQLFLQTVRV
jgi:hypothetical protein